ncbi:unnamed protein product [Heligmosomoides polygyrus]|uniref:Endo/exonuclease/phosphatase domain-containing protein n=1 Tax=Heligmosomoides polygyrus TaxID=6339 RepID=A0A183GLG3_HELPZ|nr:unnamed protein product [Heligmosomoides polygyrus]
MRGSMIRGHRGENELVRKSRNVGKTHVATLNVGTFSRTSWQKHWSEGESTYVRYERQGGPVTECSERAKDEIWTLLDEKTAELPPEEAVVITNDLNGRVGTAKDGHSCHGGSGYGANGERIVEYAHSHNLIKHRIRTPYFESVTPIWCPSIAGAPRHRSTSSFLVKHRDR